MSVADCPDLLMALQSVYHATQVSVEKATSMDPSFAYSAGPGAQGLSWYVTFPPAAGDASSLVVSTENGPESVVASAGTLTGTDPLVRVVEAVKGGLRTTMVSFIYVVI